MAAPCRSDGLIACSPLLAIWAVHQAQAGLGGSCVASRRLCMFWAGSLRVPFAGSVLVRLGAGGQRSGTIVPPLHKRGRRLQGDTVPFRAKHESTALLFTSYLFLQYFYLLLCMTGNKGERKKKKSEFEDG